MNIIKRPKLNPFLPPPKLTPLQAGIGIVKICHRCNTDLTKLPNHLVKNGTYFKKPVILCLDCYNWVKWKRITYKVRKAKEKAGKVDSDTNRELNKLASNLGDGKFGKRTRDLI